MPPFRRRWHVVVRDGIVVVWFRVVVGDVHFDWIGGVIVVGNGVVCFVILAWLRLFGCVCVAIGQFHFEVLLVLSSFLVAIADYLNIVVAAVAAAAADHYASR